MPLGINT